MNATIRRASFESSTSPAATIWNALLWGLMGFFVLNIALMVAAVATSSFATRWLGTWLPAGFTLHWYADAWKEFQLADVLTVTVKVVGAVVLVSLLIGVPASYTLARRDFFGKKALMLLFLLPLMVPPITYGIPMATVMYQMGLGGTIWGVIAANLVPALPFVVLVMTPFIEQIDPNLESAAHVFGAGTRQLFVHVLVPLLAPGILAAGLLVLVRTIAMFELTFLTAGSDSQTLVVALYYYENLTLREIGEVLGVTESRVSQMHTKAVLRLRSRMQDESFDD